MTRLKKLRLLLSISKSILERLRPHQREPAKHLVSVLHQYQSALDISDTGVGKTFVASAVAKALQLPCLVVCPKIVKSAWHRAATHFDDSLSVINYESLQTGRSKFGYWEKSSKGIAKREIYFTCMCCQLKIDFDNFSKCYCHPLGIHCIDQKKKPQNLGRFVFNDAVKFIIADEVHRCGALDSLNADMLIAAKRQNIKVLGLSATAACNPLHMRALGYNLDLHGDKADRFAPNMGDTVRPAGISYEQYANKFILPNFYRWASRYGCRRDPAFHGFKWMVGADKQTQVMRDIRSSIIPSRGVRVTVESIPNFPKRDISAELYDVDNPDNVNAVYHSIQQLEARSSSDHNPKLAITELLRAKQRLELLKVPVAAELALDYVDKGHSIGIFVNYRQTLDELSERLTGAAVIFGGQSVSSRESEIQYFQSDVVRIILIMSEAGGVGLSLPDLHGNFPRGGLVMPTDKAVTMRQIAGRFHRDDSISNCFYRILLAAGSIEQNMYRNLNQKLHNLDSLNDGDLFPI